MADTSGPSGSDEQLSQRQSTYELSGSDASARPIQSVVINFRFMALKVTVIESPGAFALDVLTLAVTPGAGVAVGIFVGVRVTVDVAAGVIVRVGVCVAAAVDVRVGVCVAAAVDVMVGVRVRVGVVVAVGAVARIVKGELVVG